MVLKTKSNKIQSGHCDKHCSCEKEKNEKMHHAHIGKIPFEEFIQDDLSGKKKHEAHH